MTEKGILVATTNPGKIKEIAQYLKNLPVTFVSLSQLQPKKMYTETGKTFQENARGKSLFYSRLWPGLTLAEDSGLEIDYLGGAPGVFSARFSEPRATDEKNIQKTLALMKNVPENKRSARFVSCLVLSKKGKIITEIQDCIEGVILREKRGKGGFGYDPIFFFPPLGKTFAEIDPKTKNRVSHRGRTLKKLGVFLNQYLL
ncbi:MAG: RdgB/HAM1 family non-canonical purine NTP pyrophosphatase [Candidatus Aminicenantes bacterium]|nr:RdgB/HAM1 family non-canonical purine NTP pyrophosphatase [Candidatus Aminicenantes bacterium]